MNSTDGKIDALVTGAPGWLGTRLVEVLCKGDPALGDFSKNPQRRVRCLVLPGANPEPLKDLPVEIVQGDIRHPEVIKSAMKGVKVVFHLAAIIHPKRVKELYEINTKGTENLLAAAAEAGVQRFIYVSSNSVAGTNRFRDKLITEEDKPEPYKHYGRSKYLAEQLVRRYHVDQKLQSVIVRPYWFYGPGQPARQTQFFRMIKQGHPFVFGDGHNLRSMSYIDNVVEGLLLAESSPKASGETYAIADKRPYTTIEIYQAIAELLGVKLRPRSLPGVISWACERVDGILQAAGAYSTYIHVAGEMTKDIACSIRKAEVELGYNPKVDLVEGMRRSIEWCRKHGVEI